ncbi:MAG: site-specific DNA-methyltransferase [Bacteroidales bacterium]|nr:site-specific DNA-methyltransferase [Bacteroidales bacterium]
MEGKSLAPQEIKLRQLKEILPEAFAEGKVDWEKLKATLGEDINFSNERYVLNWAGKSEAFKVLQAPTTKTLVPDKEESVNFDETENIFIEGENLEVLKVLQKSYFGKVKMIYIDPPYNTGNDSFIYPDKFSETKAEYQKRIGDKDEEGYLTKDGMFRKNSKENGQYHSNWMNMMYPRLFLAKNLLKQDGVIFVSIDDNEVHNLRLMMNEIFGEEKFFSQIIVRANSRGQTYKQIAKTHEYLLIYTKSTDTELFELEKGTQNSDLNLQDDISDFNIRELRNRNPKFGKHNRPNLFYSIYVNTSKFDKDGFFPVSLTMSEEYNTKIQPFNSAGKASCWRWGKDRTKKNLEENTLKSNLIAKQKNDGSYGIYEKYRKTTYKPKSIWDDNSFLTETGTIQVRELGFNDEFDFPKPINLVKQAIKLAVDNSELVLDFFAGSATTAQAVYEINKEDAKSIQYICAQLPEQCSIDSIAYTSGYKTIADIAKERIRRASKKIQAEIDAEKEKKKGQFDFEPEKEEVNIDLGFKVLKLSDSNFKQWQQIKGKDAKAVAERVEALEEQMKLFVDPVSENATIENMVYELLLKSGKDLNSKLKHKENYYCVNDNELIFMLEKASQSIVDAVIKENPQKVIALDRLFKGNDQLKTNTSLQMKDAEIEFKTI